MRKKLSLFSTRLLSAVLFLVLLLSASWCTGEEIEFTFRSSFDQTEQKAVAYIPNVCRTRTTSPLLVVAHYMGGNRFTGARTGYYPECDARGYLLVCPELHGKRTSGETSCAALEAQHDIIDAITYMKQNYSVDSSKVYIVGRSMGGMLAAVMAAKYPDLFAAAVAGQGVMDLKLFTETTIPSLIGSVERECGPYSEATRFDYERRSAVSYAPNFQYVPLMMWHGTNDTWVPPEQSEHLTETIRRFYRFQPDVFWLHGAAHCPTNFTASWVCDRLTYYENKCESGFETPTRFFPELTLVTDEAKRFFWLDITPAQENSFARIHASLKDDVLSVNVENISQVSIDLDSVSKLVRVSRFEVTTDAPLKLTIVRNGKVLFETAADKKISGALPDKLFEK
ncbi:alpha/beta fold hydrolase [bacterium]|nr:alpha/beta fold hydrolase [bacterium]